MDSNDFLCKTRAISYCFIIICVCFLGVNAVAETSFSWLPSSGTNIAGYKIHYGQVDGGPYLKVVDVGKPDEVDGRIYGKITGLQCGITYYLVCTSYTDQGIESGPSNQEVFKLDDVVPDTPADLTVVP